jgi:fatty acid desaturase
MGPGTVTGMTAAHDSAAAGDCAAEDSAAEAARRMLRVDARPVVYTGIALFSTAFLVLLPFWSWLGRHGHRGWLWTALAGALLGLLSLPLIARHSRQGRLG